jgi:hypothetical protein
MSYENAVDLPGAEMFPAIDRPDLDHVSIREKVLGDLSDVLLDSTEVWSV